MDYNKLKLRANEILLNQTKENSYIEYIASVTQIDRILKTICAYANDYSENDIQFIFMGVEEHRDENNQIVPKLPIKGINEGQIENCINEINMLRQYLYPTVSFDIVQNNYKGKEYLVIVVPKQIGGPFHVSDKVLDTKNIKLKPGRYIRVKEDTRLARIEEEYRLMKKFSKSHFTSYINNTATIDVLDTDTLKEYLSLTKNRNIKEDISKEDACRILNILDKNDLTEKLVRNFGVLMFCTHPEDYIYGAYVEIFVDLFGTKDKMFSRKYTGPIWKQYKNIVTDIKQSYINTMIVREKDKALHRKVTNYPFTAIEELVANAIVHNNYENEKAIQIYITQTEINIVNYNRPLPPLRIRDLNERFSFHELNVENPEIRNMFKDLGIIESFGTGIGEAKRALKDNDSPNLYYKVFEENPDVTSDVIPAKEEYLKLMRIENISQDELVRDNYNFIEQVIKNSNYSELIKQRLLLICNTFIDSVFCGNDICKVLDCSVNTATNYLNKLYKDLHVTQVVNGQGKGRYIFIHENEN